MRFPDWVARTTHPIDPQPVQALAPAEVGFDTATIDLGRVPWYSRMPFEAKFSNGSGSPVKIMAVKPSCGCTGIDVFKYSGLVLNPGESCTLTGAVELGKDAGSFDRPVDVLLDSGAIHTLRIVYEAFATYRVNSDRLQFGDVDLDSDQEYVQSVLFTSQTAKIVADKMTADAPWLDLAARNTGPGETEITVRIRKRNLPPGQRVVQVNVMTNDPYRMYFPLFVEFNGISELTAVPPQLFLSVGEQGCIRVVRTNGETSRILDVRCLDRDALHVTIDASREFFCVRAAGIPARESFPLSILAEGGRRAAAAVTVVRDQ